MWQARSIYLHNVPYFSQWESAELVTSILSGHLHASKDPRWRDSGAATPQEYEFWSCRACGMACLKMILAHYGLGEHPVMNLAREAMSYGAYVPKEHYIEGLIYSPCAQYINDRFRLAASSAPQLSVPDIRRYGMQGCLVMVSVHPTIRQPSAIPPTTGGHLVLVIGASADSLIIHNPSGYPFRSQSFAEIHVSDFQRFFAGRGLVVHPPA